MKIVLLATFALGLATTAFADDAPRPAATAQTFMVAAANPLAVAAGVEALRAGGSAVDAAIAVQMVLNLVEPQSSGVGGGGFMLAWDAGSETLSAYDGRETAPMAAGEDLFLTAEGERMGFWDAVVGGRSVGAPGLLRMLALAHQDHGRLPWADLFQPAIALAERGFEVSPRLHRLIADDERLARYDAARAYFYDAEGAPAAVGQALKNPEFADLMRRIAEHGPDAFYSGEIAAQIVAAVRGVADNPGLLSMDDLAAYRAVRREPVCGPYRAYRVCGAPPPSSGGVAVAQMLGLLSHFDLAALAPGSAEAAHLLAEAGRLAFADRALYLGDADFIDVPVSGLIDPGYLAARAALIDATASMGEAEAGTPPRQHGGLRPGVDFAMPSTSHLAIVDSDGGAVSMTTSIESAFGSRLMVHGVLLNNQLTDFSFVPTRDGAPVANRVQPGKRPRSSMSPTMVFDADGRLVLAIGSPGGSRIIGYVVQAIVGVLDWGLDPQAAVSLGHVVNRNGRTDLEQGTAAAALEGALANMGHEVGVRAMTSGLHAVQVTADGLVGGADPRREGVAVGD